MFKRKADGFARAKKYHLCTSCLHVQPLLFKECPSCKVEGMRVFFPSRVEMIRAGELIRMQVAGKISRLRFHPRYDLIVEGTKICAYEADSEYMLEGKTVIEDVKPFGDFMDKIAAMKISLFNAINKKHGLSVSIHRRK
jgi:hypothetical protein